VNWKKWLGYDIYKKLWSLVGGRPWTFISRDVWHKLEYFPIMLLLFAGWFSGRYWDIIFDYFAEHPMVALAGLFSISTIWYIFGHFFWGRDYIPNQKGK